MTVKAEECPLLVEVRSRSIHLDLAISLLSLLAEAYVEVELRSAHTTAGSAIKPRSALAERGQQRKSQR